MQQAHPAHRFVGTKGNEGNEVQELTSDRPQDSFVAFCEINS
jgi:hypothetical protein